MNKKSMLIRGGILILILFLMLPSFIGRVHSEADSKRICLSLDYSSLTDKFSSDETIDILSSDDTKKYADSVSIEMGDSLNPDCISALSAYDAALFIDSGIHDVSGVKSYIDGDFKELLPHLKYLCLYGDGTKNPEYSNLLEYLSDFSRENGLIAVLKESGDQLSNENNDLYYKGAASHFMRCYDTHYSANEKADPKIRYHQMLNSLRDRNTRFIKLVTFEDKANEKTENFNLMLESLEMLRLKTGDLSGFQATGRDGVQSRHSFNMALAFLLSLLLCSFIYSILFGKFERLLNILLIAAALAGVAGAYIFLDISLKLYPMLLALSLSCFTIALVLQLALHMQCKNTFKAIIIMLLATLASFFVGGYAMSAVLSGLDFSLYIRGFSGVKLSLILPVLFAPLSYFLICYTAFPVRLKRGEPKNIAFILIGLVIFFGAVYLYILRSGNSDISHIEIHLRNSLDSFMGIRPRTKEFLIGWPSLVLLIYFMRKKEAAALLPVFSLGTAVLASSVINSFCHAFTSVLSIYHRTLNGFLLGMALSVAIACICSLILKIFASEKE